MTKSLYGINDIIEGLEPQRDEIRVKLHLAKAEARDEWEDMEKKWEQLTAKAGVLGHEAGAASKDGFEATKLVAEEIKHGDERIRKK